MRKGLNPHKDVPIEGSPYAHQIIVPVYIPHHEDYFKDSFRVLKTCITSISRTVGPDTLITIVNNGSTDDVARYLDILLGEGTIHEVVHTSNIGKMNAVAKGLVGHHTPLVTIADADVLFLDGWQAATTAIFNAVPKAGVVGLTPQIKSYKTGAANVLWDLLFSPRLRFMPLADPSSMQSFYASVGWKDDYNRDYLRFVLALEFDGVKAVVGSGHFVSTFRRDVFEEMKTSFRFQLGGDSETYFDFLPLRKDYWRLTTYQNFAYHMGNVFEPWMEACIAAHPNSETVGLELYPPRKKLNSVGFFVKNLLFPKILANERFCRWFYRYKRLPAHVARNYNNIKP